MKTIAFANHKGGVGKTTSVASLGAVIARMGFNVLLVDLDSQSNLTSSLLPGLEPERTIYEAMKERAALPIINISHGLDIVPSSLELAALEIEIAAQICREQILKDLLHKVEGNYDFALIDCPPSLGLLVVNAFAAANEVFIPLTAEALPSQGLSRLSEIINLVKKGLNPQLELNGIIITRWERSKLSESVEKALRENFGDRVFNSKIRKNISLAEAPLSGKTIIDYAPGSNGATDYTKLGEEILER